MPNRACSFRSGFGAHQFQSPATRINAGTSKPLTTVASSKIAKEIPRPSILILVTPLVMKQANTIAIRTAAAVMIRPDFCNPELTEVVVSAPLSCSSLIRESRNNS